MEEARVPRKDKQDPVQSRRSTKQCSGCGTTKTPCWRRGDKGRILCNACGLKSARKRQKQDRHHRLREGKRGRKRKGRGRATQPDDEEEHEEAEPEDLMQPPQLALESGKPDPLQCNEEALIDSGPENIRTSEGPSRGRLLDAPSSIWDYGIRDSSASRSARYQLGDDEPEARSVLPPLEDDEAAASSSTTVGRPAGLWNTDTRLYLLHKWRTHLNTYRHHVWPLSPVNPDALHVSCLDYLLCTPEGREERFVRYLTPGGMLDGDFDAHWQHWALTKQHLEYVFDCTDYSVALVMSAMSHHVLFWESDIFRSSYYETLALSILKILGAYHSDAYHRCLCMHSLSFSMEKNPDPNKMVALKNELIRAKQYPYFPLTKGTSVRTSVPLRWLNVIRIVTSSVSVLTNVVAGINLFRGPGGQAYTPSNIFPQLVSALDQLEEEVRSLIVQDATEALSPVILMTQVMFITAMRAECYWCMGDRPTALAWATKFLMTSRDPYFRYIIAGIVLMLQFVLEIFYEGGELRLLREMLEVMEYHALMCDGVNKLKARFTLLLDGKIQELQAKDNNENSGGNDDSHNDTNNKEDDQDHDGNGKHGEPPSKALSEQNDETMQGSGPTRDGTGKEHHEVAKEAFSFLEEISDILDNAEEGEEPIAKHRYRLPYTEDASMWDYFSLEREDDLSAPSTPGEKKLLPFPD